DVSRPKPMTVRWSQYAQSQSDRPVKGMLTGPVTILQWSFVRDDQPRSQTCRQIALAIRDEVNDIIDSIVKMDADVLSIECSRSRMELLDVFHRVHYPNEIGPGVYDIHSPRVPDNREIETLLRKALEVLSPDQLWVNPDCGLKTRGWTEVRLALGNMVATVATLRASIAS